jgi:glycine cleavage system H protein
VTLPEPSIPETYPDDRLYHPEHDWARVEGDEATFGITWYAQNALGEVVFFDPPGIGSTLKANEVYAEVESVKAVSDVYAPLSGEVLAINEAVSETPELINEDPYNSGWLVRVRLTDTSEQEGLLDSAAYQALLKDE